MKLKVNLSSRVRLAVVGQKRVKAGTVREVKHIKHNKYYKIHWDGDISISSHNYSAKHVRILKFPGEQGSKLKFVKDGKLVKDGYDDLIARIEHMQIKKKQRKGFKVNSTGSIEASCDLIQVIEPAGYEHFARIALPKLPVACSESESWSNFTDDGSYGASAFQGDDQTECGGRELLRQVSFSGAPSEERVQRRLQGDGLYGDKERLRPAHALSVLPGLPGQLNCHDSVFLEDKFEYHRRDDRLVSEEKSWRKLIDLVAAANGDLTEDEINMSLMIEREVELLRYENHIF